MSNHIQAIAPIFGDHYAAFRGIAPAMGCGHPYHSHGAFIAVTPHDRSLGTAVIQASWVPSLRQWNPGCLPPGDYPYEVVPSTLTRHDQRIAELRAALRRAQIRTSLLLPRSPLSGAVPKLAADSRWSAVTVGNRAARVDARLVTSPWTVVVPVDHATRLGPFVLDLPARFLHPSDRLRLLASPDRERRIADIAAPALPGCALVCIETAGGWLILATTDAIAAELCALALAEQFLDPGLEMQGPWEDPTVQRATELELGARLPREIHIELVHGDSFPHQARALLAHIAGRLGIGM